jgi:hypothetical protein
MICTEARVALPTFAVDWREHAEGLSCVDDSSTKSEGNVRLLAIAVLELAFAVSLFSAFFMVVEWVATLRFAQWAFRMGPRVIREVRPIPAPPIAPADSILGTERGEFVQLSRDTWLFRPRSRGFAVLDWFAVKGVLDFKEGEAGIVGRLPLSSVLFLDSWTIGWISGCVAMVMSGNNVVLGAVLGLLVLGAAVAIRLVLVPLEVRRAQAILDDFESIVGDQTTALGKRR